VGPSVKFLVLRWAPISGVNSVHFS
jgi:hypothetical protein